MFCDCVCFSGVGLLNIQCRHNTILYVSHCKTYRIAFSSIFLSGEGDEKEAAFLLLNNSSSILAVVYELEIEWKRKLAHTENCKQNSHRSQYMVCTYVLSPTGCYFGALGNCKMVRVHEHLSVISTNIDFFFLSIRL